MLSERPFRMAIDASPVKKATAGNSTPPWIKYKSSGLPLVHLDMKKCDKTAIVHDMNMQVMCSKRKIRLICIDRRSGATSVRGAALVILADCSRR